MNGNILLVPRKTAGRDARPTEGKQNNSNDRKKCNQKGERKGGGPVVSYQGVVSFGKRACGEGVICSPGRNCFVIDRCDPSFVKRLSKINNCVAFRMRCVFPITCFPFNEF